MCSVWLKRVVTLVIGILDMLVAGSIYSYNVYAPSLQLTFNFTQEEIDTVPSFGHFGFCIGMPAGLLRFKCGSMWVSVVGFVISTTGYLLIWSALFSKFVYRYKSWLLSLYYFVAGHGLVYLYMEALITNMKNFPRRYRGTAIGFMDAIFGASGGFFIILYKLLFAHSTWSTFDEKDNLVGFILFLAASCGFAGITSIIGLREYKDVRRLTVPTIPSIPDVREYTSQAYEYPRNDSESSSAIVDEDESDDLIPIVGSRPRCRVIIDRNVGSTSGQQSPESTETSGGRDATGLELLRSVKFHCLVWPFLMIGGVCFVVITNIEYVLGSFHLEEYISTCIVVMAVSNGVARILCGLVSDRCIESVPRANVWLSTLTPLLVVSAFINFYMDQAFVLILWSIVLGVAYGSLWSLVPTIMSESYGTKYFGVNWGCTLFVSALFSLGLQFLFGYLYDLHLSSGSLFCAGIACYRWSFIIFTFLIGISTFLVGVLCRLTDEDRA